MRREQRLQDCQPGTFGRRQDSWKMPKINTMCIWLPRFTSCFFIFIFILYCSSGLNYSWQKLEGVNPFLAASSGVWCWSQGNSIRYGKISTFGALEFREERRKTVYHGPLWILSAIIFLCGSSNGSSLPSSICQTHLLTLRLDEIP